jgi:hypothetical protein
VVTTQQKIKVWMQVVVSLLLLVTGILVLTAPNYVLRHDFDEATKRFAAGWIGAIIGYWLSEHNDVPRKVFISGNSPENKRVSRLFSGTADSAPQSFARK